MEICIPSVKNVFLLAKGRCFYFHLYICLRNANSAGECDFIGDMTPEEDLSGVMEVETAGSASAVRAAWIN